MVEPGLVRFADETLHVYPDPSMVRFGTGALRLRTDW
jgi:hypothetical protein